jgi:hypothetical protein
MSLGNIVRVLGGDLYDGGRRANIPAPGHSAADRSVSLLLRDDRVFVHTFGDSDWREVLDDLRARRLVDGGTPAVGSPEAADSASAATVEPSSVTQESDPIVEPELDHQEAA